MAIKTHIFLTCVWIPNPSDKMEGLFLLRYSQSLYVSGYDPVVLGVKYSDSEPEIIRYEQDFIPIRIQTYNGGKFNRFKAWKQLLEHCIEEFGRPRLIWHHVFDYNSLVVQYFSSQLKLRMYVTEHWSRWFQESKSTFRLFELRLIKRYMPKLSGVSAVSPILANRIEQLTQIEIPYITPVPIADEIAHQKQSYDCEIDNYLLHISCFDNSSKRIKKLIEEFLKWNTKTQLVLIGTGKDFEVIHSKYGSHDRIHFLGEILDKQEIIKYLQNATALVQSSLYETYSMVLSEALISGCPVISTNVGIWNSIQSSTLGYTIPKNFKKKDLVKAYQEVQKLDRQVIQNQAKNKFSDGSSVIQMLSFLWLH